MILEENELETIVGGGKSLWAIVGAIGVFIAGFVDGFLRPFKCN